MNDPGPPLWYYASSDRKKLGPINWEEMRRLAASGTLLPSQMVMLDGAGRWQSAASVAGLFPTEPLESIGLPATDVPIARSLPTLAPDPGSASTAPFFPASMPSATEPAGLSAVPLVPGYTIIRELGRGGMGVVYEAMQTALNRRVALKMVLAGAHAGTENLARFQQEAETVANVEHENIVRIYERGDSNGLPFFSLELIEGGTLEHRLNAGPLAVRDCAQLLESLALAVHHVHEKGVIHRDLKPANVLLTLDGRPKISDFGLARLLLSSDGQTRTGAVMGTPQYMAPEQAAGETKQAGRQADVYALGAILYRCLAGKPPFNHPALREVLRRVQEDEPDRPRRSGSNIPLDLEIISLKCLRKKPEERYQTAEELAQDLRRFLNHEPIHARSLPVVVRLWRWTIRSRARAAIMGLSALLLLLCLVLGMMSLNASRKRADEIRTAAARYQDAKLSFAAGQYEAAHATLTTAQALLASHSGEGALREEINELLETSGSLMNLKTFRESAAEAEYHILGRLWTRLPGEEVGPNHRREIPSTQGAQLDRGIELARKALKAFDLLDAEDLVARCKQPGLREEESALVQTRAAEMFFLLALAVERQALSAGRKELEDARKEAARLLELSGRLDDRSLMLHQERVRLQRLLGDPAPESAAARRPSTFLDHHLQGGQFSRERKWQKAESAFQLALIARPDEYWTLFRLAKAKESLKQFGQAEALFRSCTALRPNDPVAFNNRGTVLNGERRWKEAEQVFEDCLQRDRDYTPAYGNLILAHAEQRRPDRAEEVMNRYRKLGHQRPEEEAWMLNHLGVAYERARQLPRALASYDAALEKDAKLVEAHRNRSIVLAAMGRFPEAEGSLRTAIELNERDGELWYVLGNLYANWGRGADALKAMQTAVVKAPQLPEAWYNLGVLLRRRGEVEKALECQQQALELVPGWIMPLQESASCLAKLKDFGQALKIVEMLAEDRQEDAELLRMRGSLLGDVGRFKESEEVLTRAIERDSKHPTGHLNRAVTYMRSKQWRKAVDDFNAYLNLAPDGGALGNVFNDISVALWELSKETNESGLLREALAALDRAIELRKTPSNLSNRGNFYLQIGEKEKALADFNETLKLQDRYIRAWALRGQLYLRLGDHAQAARDLRRAVDLDPEHTETPLFLALALVGQGEIEAARGLLEKVAQKRANHPRGHFAKGLLRYLDGKFSDAVLSLSRAYDEEPLRPWTVLLRGRSWARIGGGGIAAARADAAELVSLLPRDGLAHFQAACIEALTLKGGAGMKEPVDRILDSLGRALELQPELRARLRSEPDLKPLEQHPRFEQLLRQK